MSRSLAENRVLGKNKIASSSNIFRLFKVSAENNSLS